MSAAGDRPMGREAALRLAESRWVGLDEIVETGTFAFRETGDVTSLAESIIRHGQWEPVDLRARGDGLELVSGHRRVAAARMLGRRRVLGRVHHGLADEDALFLAISDDLDRRPWTIEEHRKLRELLSARGPLPPKVGALLDRPEADWRQESPETTRADGDEVDADFMAASVRDRLADACNDLAALHEMWGDLDEGRRADLVQCVAYLKDMYPFLVVTEGEDP